MDVNENNGKRMRNVTNKLFLSLSLRKCNRRDVESLQNPTVNKSFANSFVLRFVVDSESIKNSFSGARSLVTIASKETKF